jgi:maltose alpha-D-glucosyltransferase / alpha-amylase
MQARLEAYDAAERPCRERKTLVGAAPDEQRYVAYPPGVPTTVSRADVAAAIVRLGRAALAERRWFGAKGGTAIRGVRLDEAFVLDPAGPHVLAIATFTLDDGTRQRYQVGLTAEAPGAPLREALPGDGTWRALAVAMHDGRAIAALPSDDDPAASPRAGLVCRPGPAMPAGGPGTERDLGADQSNTSVVLGAVGDAGGDTAGDPTGQVLLKAFRRLQPGLNPDLEMTAFLSEQAGFTAVPPLAGFVELVEARGDPTTIALAQQFVADGADAYESIAEALAAWLRAPGEVSLEFATEVAADLGALTAGLHAAATDPTGHGLPTMAPRPATRAEVRAWAAGARDHLDRALEVAPKADSAAATLRRLAPRIADVLTVLDALPTTPEVIRAHGDYHLGQVLIAPDGYRIIDFEGEPLSTPEERRAHRHPLRDVASMLRSLDHVGRSAGRRAERVNGGPLERPGLDLPGWLRRSRERFLEAYRSGLLEARVVPDLDPALLLAFEVDKELYEFAYAATYLPSWLWAPTEGMRGLFAEDGP